MTDKTSQGAPSGPPASILRITEELADGATPSLRELVRGLPLPGAPWLLWHQGEELNIEPGEWRSAGYVDDATQLPPNCPVRPLGKGDGGCYFLDPMGSIVHLKPAAGKGDFDFLFAPFNDYLLWAWARSRAKKRASDPVEVDNFHAEQVRQDLFRAAALKGRFDLNEMVRGRGCWTDSGGGIVIHAGDKIWYQGSWREPGEIDGVIYTGKRAIPRPNLSPGHAPPGGMAASCVRVLEVLRSWNWTQPEIDPQLMLGWIVSALLGAALSNRPVAWVTGQEGSGKSTLYAFIKRIMDGKLITAADATAAFIYQTLKEDVLAVMLDEQEADADTRRTDAIIKLARVSFSGDYLGRGGQDGVPSNFALRSSFLASGIVKPSMSTQDESRMVAFMIRPIEESDGAGAPYAESETKALAADIFGRAVGWWPRYRELLGIVRRHLIRNGYDSRAADTYGNLIACYHVAAHDHMVSEKEMDWWLERLPRSERMSSWQTLIRHLLEKTPDERRVMAEKNVDAIIDKYRRDLNTTVDYADCLNDANKQLRAYGLKLAHSCKHVLDRSWDNLELFIPNAHVGLQSLLDGTKWAGKAGDSGAWANVLDQMPAQLWYRPSPQRVGLPIPLRGRFVRLAAMLSLFGEVADEVVEARPAPVIFDDPEDFG